MRWFINDCLVFNSCLYSAISIFSPGLNATVQDLPRRSIGLGIPPSGPMDDLAFQASNIIVGNDPACEGIEIVLPSGQSNLAFSIFFHVESVIAVTGADAIVKIDGNEVTTWSRALVPAGSKVSILGAGTKMGTSQGLRAYMAVWGGFPHIPQYLGSKSTSMGNGGYQVGLLAII